MESEVVHLGRGSGAFWWGDLRATGQSLDSSSPTRTSVL